MSRPRWFVAGDLDGFLGLGLDNLIQILLILSLCRGVIHAWRFTQADTVLQLGWGEGASWAQGYGLMALVFALAALWEGRSSRQGC